MRVKKDLFLERILCVWQWSISKVLELVKKKVLGTHLVVRRSLLNNIRCYITLFAEETSWCPMC
jgi:hypothetical protein